MAVGEEERLLKPINHIGNDEKIQMFLHAGLSTFLHTPESSNTYYKGRVKCLWSMGWDIYGHQALKICGLHIFSHQSNHHQRQQQQRKSLKHPYLDISLWIS
ncbi:hypothetical protein K1719_009987 [Acacia pycnantha]|nr:hypothetical protein K1719_009987 [Acacia pycnantha]